MNRVDLQALLETRIQEAKSLLAAGFTDGAYYLAGYSVECALKACIAKQTQEHDFPDKKLVNESHTHNLTELMRLAELTPILRAAMQTDTSFEDDWLSVKNWSKASRYEYWSSADAQSMLEAIERPSGGLLRWIRLHW